MDQTIWALKDVSFEACPELSRRVQRGKVVGIPSTGSGQALGATARGRRRLLYFDKLSASDRLSTRLKIFSRITEPAEGHVETLS